MTYVRSGVYVWNSTCDIKFAHVCNDFNVYTQEAQAKEAMLPIKLDRESAVNQNIEGEEKWLCQLL